MRRSAYFCLTAIEVTRGGHQSRCATGPDQGIEMPMPADHPTSSGRSPLGRGAAGLLGRRPYSRSPARGVRPQWTARRGSTSPELMFHQTRFSS